MNKIISIMLIVAITGAVAETKKLFYPNGIVKSAIAYKYGKKNGTEHDYYPDGATLMYAKPYVNDKLHGIMQAYTESAILKYETSYQHGVLDGRSRYYNENGQLKAEVDYKNGLKEGNMNLYYPSGMLKMETYWTEGKLTEGYKYGEDGSRKGFSAEELRIFAEVNK